MVTRKRPPAGRRPSFKLKFSIQPQSRQPQPRLDVAGGGDLRPRKPGLPLASCRCSAGGLGSMSPSRCLNLTRRARGRCAGAGQVRRRVIPSHKFESLIPSERVNLKLVGPGCSRRTLPVTGRNPRSVGPGARGTRTRLRVGLECLYLRVGSDSDHATSLHHRSY